MKEYRMSEADLKLARRLVDIWFSLANEGLADQARQFMSACEVARMNESERLMSFLRSAPAPDASELDEESFNRVLGTIVDFGIRRELGEI